MGPRLDGEEGANDVLIVKKELQLLSGRATMGLELFSLMKLRSELSAMFGAAVDVGSSSPEAKSTLNLKNLPNEVCFKIMDYLPANSIGYL